MACNCHNKTGKEYIAQMATTNLVNLEGKMVPRTAVPNGAFFIKGVWYGSHHALPEELFAKYAHLFASYKIEQMGLVEKPTKQDTPTKPTKQDKPEKKAEKNTKTAGEINNQNSDVVNSHEGE